jgi:hypothetical protein
VALYASFNSIESLLYNLAGGYLTLSALEERLHELKQPITDV